MKCHLVHNTIGIISTNYSCDEFCSLYFTRGKGNWKINISAHFFFSSGNTSYVFCTVVKGNRGQSRRLRNIKLGKNND